MIEGTSPVTGSGVGVVDGDWPRVMTVGESSEFPPRRRPIGSGSNRDCPASGADAALVEGMRRFELPLPRSKFGDRFGRSGVVRTRGARRFRLRAAPRAGVLADSDSGARRRRGRPAGRVGRWSGHSAFTTASGWAARDGPKQEAHASGANRPCGCNSHAGEGSS